MGQRLVVTIENDEEVLCKIYYHWSAYSIRALREARDIINELFDEDKRIYDIRIRMIRFVESNGGGIANGKDGDEWQYIQNTYPNAIFKEEGILRNYGLIAISEDGMNALQGWSEGDIYINISNGRVVNFVNFPYVSIDAFNEARREWDDSWKDLALEDIPELHCDLSEFNIDDIDYLIDELRDAQDFVVRYKNVIYELFA